MVLVVGSGGTSGSGGGGGDGTHNRSSARTGMKRTVFQLVTKLGNSMAGPGCITAAIRSKYFAVI